MHGIQHATGDFILIMDADMSHHVRSRLSVLWMSVSASLCEGNEGPTNHRPSLFFRITWLFHRALVTAKVHPGIYKVSLFSDYCGTELAAVVVLFPVGEDFCCAIAHWGGFVALLSAEELLTIATRQLLPQ